jgi:hypothetical protein
MPRPNPLDDPTVSPFEVAEAAAQLNLTVQEVYLAKSRCMERIRSLIQRLQSAYDDD